MIEGEIIKFVGHEITGKQDVRVIKESELFWYYEDGSLKLKRDAFRAIPILHLQEVYDGSPTGEPDDLYRRLYPIYVALKEKGPVRMEDTNGGSLSPEELEGLGGINDTHLTVLETDVAVLLTLGFNVFARRIDEEAGRPFVFRSVFEDGGYKSGNL